MATTTSTLQDKYIGALLGLAIGDALGTTVETFPREYCLKTPVTNIVGGGKYNLLPGQVNNIFQVLIIFFSGQMIRAWHCVWQVQILYFS